MTLLNIFKGIEDFSICFVLSYVSKIVLYYFKRAGSLTVT